MTKEELAGTMLSLIVEVRHLNETVKRFEKRLHGCNGDGLLTRVSLLEQWVKGCRWWHRAMVGCVATLLLTRVWELWSAAEG